MTSPIQIANESSLHSEGDIYALKKRAANVARFFPILNSEAQNPLAYP